jgi:predicted AlkP superfamily pyrophosphatase or phosphodiesterase
LSGLSLPVPPRYGDASVADLLPDALDVLSGGAPRLLPLPADVRAVIVLVVDGLGRRNLDDHGDAAPTLVGAPGPTLDAPFPTTTATSLSCIGTGRPPGGHGVTGYSVAVPGTDRPLITLTWSWDRQIGGDDARDDVRPEDLQPAPTVFDRARERGVRPVTVLRPEFATSGLTRAGLRGGDLVAATELTPSLDAALTAATAHDGRTLAYVHHGDLDTIGHLTAPSSDPWCEELTRIDGELARFRDRLPADVALVVTADHGMVHVPEDGFVELTERPELLDGVRVLTGDGRARQLHVRPGARDEVLATWRDHVGDRGHVVTRDEAIAAGWFGSVRDEAVHASIGDVLVVADAPVAWVHRDADLFGGRLPGLHAGLTRREVEVPALVLTSRSDA